MAKKFQLYYPLKPHYVGQQFGDDKACLLLEDKKTVIGGVGSGICPVGYVSLYAYAGMKGHNALDLSLAYGRGQLILAAHDGWINYEETDASRGLGIGVISNEKFDLGEYGEHYIKTRYWHCLEFVAQNGAKINAGEVIAKADNTGYSSGDHLHFEMKPVDFTASFQSIDNIYNVFQNNGYYGAVDPSPFFNGIYALDIPQVISSYQQIISLYQQIIAKIKGQKLSDRFQ